MGSDVEAVADADHGLHVGFERARAHGGPLIVAGSLYLVGAVRGTLLGTSPATGA
jgi:hypothetical protein